MEQLYEFFNRKLKSTPTDFLRYKYDRIKWNGRAFGIVGPRGVGKSTMILQHIKLNLDTADTLYVSADHLYFSEHSLVDLADYFVKMGGKHLFIDEIHKYEGWSREVKQIYDSYGELQIVISGSSILDIYKGMADLSRRFPIYEMQGLSFREYLKLFHDIDTPVFNLDEILSHKAVLDDVKHPLPLFKVYDLRRNLSDHIEKSYIYLFFIFSITLHNLEEALWLPQWSKLSTKFQKRVEKNEFHFAVIVITTLAYLSTGLFLNFPHMSILKYIYFGFVGAMIINVIFPHLISTVLMKVYSPGILTGIFLIIPMNFLIINNAVNDNIINLYEVFISSLVVGLVLLFIIHISLKIGKKLITYKY